MSWFHTGPQKEKSLGQRGEEYAQAHYRTLGFSIIGTNFFNTTGKRLGEVDFIAKNNRKIIFVEVKTRVSKIGKFGTGAEAVNYFKQQKLLKTVKLYIVQHPQLKHLQPQIDVCVLEWPEVDKAPKSVTIIPNAVEDSFNR